jgi:hypothetical protein
MNLENNRRWLASDCILEEARFDEMLALEESNATRKEYFEVE